MNLQDAVTQIDRIHSHLERTETFRGYRSATVAISGVLAICGAVFQGMTFLHPLASVDGFLTLWIGIAMLSVTVTGCEMAWRCSVTASPRELRSTRAAVVRFLPCLVAGALVTWILQRHSPESAWMYPGLWSVMFSLGVFASSEKLPRGAMLIGVHYLATGAFCLAVARDQLALAPWTMAITFGVGQLMTALVLWYSLERQR